MHTKNIITKAVAAALLAGGAQAIAQEAPDDSAVERIAVTGSSIKRTDLEGALPITTLSAADIAKTGVTSVPDLIQTIPSMQGFTAPSESVGGGGGGVASAALRGLDSEYTLVLLNGKRMAPSGSGSSVDVNSIPIAAIERVEVLTDGASALYGSDAIAGVVNFILKKDIQETTIAGRFDAPEDTGGDNYTFSLTTGYGDLSRDGFNVYFAYSREDQEELKAIDRDHSRTGIINFNHNGNDLVYVADSQNAIPANAYLEFADETFYNFNPYRAANGQCGPNNAPVTTVTEAGSNLVCGFDFTSTLEIIPEYERDNFLLGGLFEVSDDAEVYTTISYSEFETISRIAPYPTLGFGLPTDGILFQTEVYPHLPADIQARVDNGEVTSSIGQWRVLPGGNRTSEFSTDSLFVDLGIRGEWEDISYDLSVNYSDSERETNLLTGYPLQREFVSLLASGQLNVFAAPDDIPQDQIELLQGAIFSGLDTSTETELLSFNGSFSAPVYELSAGTVYFGGGFDYRETSYVDRSSEANQRAVILFTSPDPEFDLERESFGFFLESVVPVFENFELTASVRYDDISAVENTVKQNSVQLAEYMACHGEAGCEPGGDLLLDENGEVVADGSTSDVGEDLDDTTYKVSVAYRPTDEWLIRASVGTGFKAPTMRQIAEPRIPFGVTGQAYACPFGSNDSRSDLCLTGNRQYDVFREGNAALQPEESDQFSVGFVYSPTNEFSVSLDYWDLELTNQVRRPTQQNIFADPARYSELFTSSFDEGRQRDVLAVIQGPVNVGEVNTSGLDWMMNVTNDLGWATLNTSLNGTYIIESESLVVGTENEFETSLGRKGSDEEVVFRNKVRIVNTLTHGDFSHTLNIAYQSGYTDAAFPGGHRQIRVADPETGGPTTTRYTGGVQLNVPSHAIVDWSSTWNYDESLSVTVGANNLTDKLPPLALGASGGHQRGFDPRYFDSYGRTFYLQGQYTF